jgi:hypothetical protein
MQKSIGIAICCLLLSLLTFDAAFAARVALPRTGQTASYAVGDDGDKLKGVAAPSPRFTDNGNGTVTDNLTGLIWLKNANCTDTVGGIAKASGYLDWANALVWSNNLASGSCGLSDGSTAGQWRLPSGNELASLMDLSKYSPALPAGHPFASVRSSGYWSGSTYAGSTANAWVVGMDVGYVGGSSKTFSYYVWPVRAGQ